MRQLIHDGADANALCAHAAAQLFTVLRVGAKHFGFLEKLGFISREQATENLRKDPLRFNSDINTEYAGV